MEDGLKSKAKESSAEVAALEKKMKARRPTPFFRALRLMLTFFRPLQYLEGEMATAQG